MSFFNFDMFNSILCRSTLTCMSSKTFVVYFRFVGRFVIRVRGRFRLGSLLAVVNNMVLSMAVIKNMVLSMQEIYRCVLCWMTFTTRKLEIRCILECRYSCWREEGSGKLELKLKIDLENQLSNQSCGYMGLG